MVDGVSARDLKTPALLDLEDGDIIDAMLQPAPSAAAGPARRELICWKIAP